MKNFDLIIIGSGPGGYVAAIRASQLGLKTAIIERDKLGGICLNWGCIPTKALLKSSELNYTLSNLDSFGIKMGKPQYDWKKIISRTRKVASKLSSGVEYLLNKNKVEIIYGSGRIAGPGKIIVKKKSKDILLEAPNIIVATGAKPKFIPGIDISSKNFWSYKEAMIPDKIPKRILVVGAGAIGIEFASFYNDFGTEVILLEVQKNILPTEDIEISNLAKKHFEKSGIKILTSTKALDFKSSNKGVICSLEHDEGNKEKFTFDKILMAIGIEGNIENLGLENVGVEVENGKIKSNQFGYTSQEGIYAIGDVAGPPWLAHKASHEGIRCVEHILNPSLNKKAKLIVPSCIFSRPQIASVGLTEQMAIEEGLKIRVGRFPLKANGKAIAIQSPEGLIKTIFNHDTGELIGAHMIGAEVTELISSYCVAMQLEATEDELFNIIFPHPTISESLHESVLNAFERSIHI